MQRLEVDPEDDLADVTALAVGEELVLEVPETGTTGFAWTAAVEPVDSLTTTGSELEPPATSPPGAPGVRRFSFVATTPGETTIELRLSRSWESGRPPHRRAVVQVTVREPEDPDP